MLRHSPQRHQSRPTYRNLIFGRAPTHCTKLRPGALTEAVLNRSLLNPKIIPPLAFRPPSIPLAKFSPTKGNQPQRIKQSVLKINQNSELILRYQSSCNLPLYICICFNGIPTMLKFTTATKDLLTNRAKQPTDKGLY